MKTEAFLGEILNGIVTLLEPLAEALSDKESFEAFIERFGWQLGASATIESIEAALPDLKTTVEQLKKVAGQLKQGDLDASAISTLVGNGRPLVQKVLSIVNSIAGNTAAQFEPFNNPEFRKTFPSEVLQYLLYTYIEKHLPKLFGVLSLVGILQTAEVSDRNPLPYTSYIVDWQRLTSTISEPDKILQNAFGWGTPSFATTGIDLINQAMAQMFAGFRLPASVASPAPEDLDIYYAEDNPYRKDTYAVAGQLYQEVVEAAAVSSLINIGLVVMPIPALDGSGNPDKKGAPGGLVVIPDLLGALDSGTFPITDKVKLGVEGDFRSGHLVRLELYPKLQDIRLRIDQASGGTINGGLHIDAQARDTWRLLGSQKSTRLELSQAHAAFEIKGQNLNDFEAIIEVVLNRLIFTLDFGDGDGFLTKLLGSNPQSLDLSSNVRWSSKRGLSVGGRPRLDLALPINKRLLEVIDVTTLYMRLQKANEGEGIELEISLTGSLQLGPLFGTVDRLGLAVALKLPPNNAMPGFDDLSFRFRPPNGAGLSLKSEAIAGGGYLFFDETVHQYGGIVFLEAKTGLAIKAVGLITTRLPDGSPGFSLLLIITVEFPPIQLGWGFTLNGLGGLIGLNRTMSIDALREGARTRALDSIMFPPNPIENAHKIISDLQKVFPPRASSFVIGPMVRLGWGVNSIITADLGILIEIGIPLQVSRLAVLGRVQLALPDARAPIVLVHLDVIGTLDITTKDVGIDATLYDSRVAVFSITGQMAFRLNWGDNPIFVMAIGGFHPRFPAPAGFPALSRLTISLATGDNPRLRLESYVALTSNTIQIGARLEVYAAKKIKLVGDFSAETSLSFDAIINLVPLSFQVDMAGTLTIKRNGKPIVGADLDLHLSGPGQWHAWGEVSFRFLGSRRSVPINVTIGEAQPLPPPPPVDVLEELRNAVSEPSNWSAQLPDQGHQYVTLRNLTVPDSAIVMHPFGALTFRQRIVPLELPVRRFGGSVPVLPGPYHVTVTSPGTGGNIESVRDSFARAQFFDLTDEEKLAFPAFEPFVSGVRGVASSSLTAEEGVSVQLEYEEAVVNVDETLWQEDPFTISADLLRASAVLGAAGAALYRNEGSAAYVGKDKAMVTVNTPSYVVTSVDSMTPVVGHVFVSHTEATLDAQHHTVAVQVAGSHEVSA